MSFADFLFHNLLNNNCLLIELRFLGIVVAIYFIAKLIQRGVEGMALGGINKIGGALFGALKFALVMSVVIFVIDAIEKSYPVISFQTKKESLLYKPVGMIAPMIIPGLSNSKAATFLPKASDEKMN